MNLFVGQGIERADTENRHVPTKREEGKELNWKIRADIYTHTTTRKVDT